MIETHVVEVAPGLMPASFALELCGELFERTLLFAAASSNRMPGRL